MELIQPNKHLSVTDPVKPDQGIFFPSLSEASPIPDEILNFTRPVYAWLSWCDFYILII